ncbi:ABC transporter substrate binding protein, partial [Streptococcus suis]
QGVLFTYGADYESLGRQTAKMAIQILKGKKPSEIPAEYPKAVKAVVNKKMAKLLGIDVSHITE